MFDQVVHVFVVEVPLHQPEIVRRLALHLGLEELLEQGEVFDDGVDFFAVERQSLFQLVEDADEIQHEAVRFHHLLVFIFIGAVHTGDGLEQGMVAHGLVEIHGVENRRVEPGQQLFGHDKNLGKLAELDEGFPYLLFPLLVQMPLLHVGGIVIATGVNDG